MIGLKRGTVQLYEHDEEREREAARTIARLKRILGDAARDIQHVGSTAVPSVKAKPILDIAVAVEEPEDILRFEEQLKEDGFYYCPHAQANHPGQLLFARGSYYEGTGDAQTHFIHIVRAGGEEWNNYLRFRDHLNATPSAAKEYEALKVRLASEAPEDGRAAYTQGKHELITRLLRDAQQAPSKAK